MSNQTCTIHTLRTVRTREPDGSVREYAKGYDFVVPADLVAAWVEDGAVEVVGPAPVEAPPIPKPRAVARIETNPNFKAEAPAEIDASEED